MTMEADQVVMVRELLERRKAILQAALSKNGKNGHDKPAWVLELGPSACRKMLKSVQAAMERLESEDFGFCSECFVSMPWADILRIPERDMCDSCAAKKASQRLKGRGSRSQRKVRSN